MNRGSCPKCRSTKIIKRVAVWGDSHRGGMQQSPVRLHTYENPDALLLQGMRTSDVTALVCSQCGFTEMYANDPLALVVPDSFDA